MSTEPIKAGDLVIGVHQCCDANGTIGIIRTVLAVEPAIGRCPACLKEYEVDIAMLGYHRDKSPWGVPTWWLKRIDPPAQDEHTEHREVLTA